MTPQRVVITGAGMITALGNTWKTIKKNLENNVSAVKCMDDWKEYKHLHSYLAAPVDFTEPSYFNRKNTRSMGKVSKLAVASTMEALIDSKLYEHSFLQNGELGVAYGSSIGSPPSIADFVPVISEKNIKNVNAMTYLRMMGHTTAVNISVFFKTKGRIIPSSSACTSSSQALGYAYEAIKYGKQKIMIAGGAEELCPSINAIFDVLYAASRKNNEPQFTPKPFDKERDGLVIGEGAATLILESYEHAMERGANIISEIVGYGTNSDGDHLTFPNTNTMASVMELAIKDANISAEEIKYVNAHCTGTLQGDPAESLATHKVFGRDVAISSVKGNTGHTLGACGALEAYCTANMLREQSFMHTLNLKNVDSKCAELHYLKNHFAPIQSEYAMSNNFAFGGINTSLIFKKP